MSKPAVSKEQPDFSIVLGGPLYQLFRRAHLSGDALELVRRRILDVFCIAWLPAQRARRSTGRLDDEQL